MTDTMPFQKYRPYETVSLPDRTWPDRVLHRAPIWCSTDLRDGNQALVNPMDAGRKRRFFDLLLTLGIREIEVGFPAASKADFDFVRTLIDQELIPDGVTIAVLTQARPELIERSFEAIEGAKRAIMHLYNSTSVTQRRVVFRMEREGITELAVNGTALCKRLAGETAAEVVFQYSPESFHHTELDYAVEICERVAEEWGPTPDAKMIVNLPTTVEQFPPNVYADRMEWFGRHFSFRDASILSVHPHNDRGTAVATAEMGLMAGAERVEGTLFGNGERTGNVDIVTIALNLFTQGVDPQLDLSQIDDAREIVEECNELPVHPRHPYVGELVYTAFSGSHQDAIKKGMDAQARSGSEVWDVPYLSIDPKDVGRSYEAIIRVNSQSGKGGVAYLMAVDHNLELPRGLQVDFARQVQRITDARGGELTGGELMEAFTSHYLAHVSPYELLAYTHSSEEDSDQIAARVKVNGEERVIEGEGNGPLAALVDAFEKAFGISIAIRDYHEHAMSASADAKAAAYVEADVGDEAFWGVGVHGSILTASLRAIVNAVNRAEAARRVADATVEAFEGA
ncbi:MAG: 2-isopropylmalate synthase [Thermoleophilia bacterium]|nr:2-isopropylmalate synthase [Thermoleophilia bacterium]